ncbi:MAG: sialidase family protein [Chloroflexota bacterium]|nr:sialidase family protein [Chloroflexota bacterium]
MLTKTAIFQQQLDRPMTHCATLTELPDGTLLAAWFAGAYETSPDVVIQSARLAPGSSGWSTPQVMAELPGHSVGQPVFLKRPDGGLWLFFVGIMGREWTSAQPFLQRSSDGGESWSTPGRLIDYPGLMFRSRPVILTGRIILPVYDENSWKSRMMISDDDGKSWRLTDPIKTPPGNIHPCVVRLDDGRLLAYLRTGGSGGVIWRTTSDDRGDTWHKPRPTELANPNSGLDLLRLQDGSLVLAYNHSDRLRTPLCVALATENEAWGRPRTIEDAPAEFSYPTLLQSQNGTIHMVYTYRRQHIHHAAFPQTWLHERQKSDEPKH